MKPPGERAAALAAELLAEVRAVEPVLPGLGVGLEDGLVDVEVDQQARVRHAGCRALVDEVVARNRELRLAQVEQRAQQLARVGAPALLVGAPHDPRELADAAGAFPVRWHPVRDVQRDQRHPRLEVQLAELDADDAGGRGQQLAGVDDEPAARPGAEQLPRRGGGILVHPALEGPATTHRQQGALADERARHRARTYARWRMDRGAVRRLRERTATLT